ncbi:hypothetical protein WS48_15135 [Burkholderia sp. RF7-non_BP1]|nr:hypothetical protein WS45_28690 [Burkholderia sp. RF2-non_BP3]KUY79121.1 hypothetical protein WS46_20045 [Burkholderia sp. RF4-BP95]KUY96931.1 hypothetical protein WS48_15135 [Burkholderia sp. RF7-non_BP1]KUZ05016.1 hypothetical protein WS49_07210 [Burkholderia sp. RF7-non_BP4]
MTPAMTRRQFLYGAGALGGLLLAPALPVWARADMPPGRRAPAAFVDLSAALLGIEHSVLDPAVAPDDLALASVFYDLGSRAGPDGLHQLEREYIRWSTSGMHGAVIAHALLTAGVNLPRTDAVGTFARLTMLMWLYGVWYGGTECDRHSGARAHITDPAYQVDGIVSGRAYRAAWIWRVAQAHPPGFSQFSFGSWAEPPPSLADYGIHV